MNVTPEARRPWRAALRSLLLVLAIAITTAPVPGALAAAAPTPISAQALERANRAYENADWTEAIRLLVATIDRAPADDLLMIRAREMLARCYAKSAAPDSARRQVWLIMKRDPNWVPDPVLIPPGELAVLRQAREEWLPTHDSPALPVVERVTTPTESTGRSKSGRVELGILLGVGAAMQSVKYEFPDGIEPRSRLSGSAGAFIDLRLGGGGRVALESGIVYRMKGGRSEFTSEYTDTNGVFVGTTKSRLRWNLDYLTVPLMVLYRFGPGDTGFFAGLGPEVGIPVSMRSGYDRLADVRAEFTSLDIAISAVVGTRSMMAGHAAFARAYLSNGLLDSFQPSGPIVFDVQMHSRLLSLEAGVRF